MLLAAVLLSGCGTQAIVVSEAAITDDPDKRVVGWTADEAPRLVFSPEDEEVTLRALFEFNYRGVYEWYKVEWIAPDGSPYKVVSLRTDFGSHRDIKASLKVRGKMASRLPGVWRARLWLRGREGAPDRLLVSRLFRISEPTDTQRLAGLTPVDVPVEDAPRPLAQSASPRAVPPQAAAPAPGERVTRPAADSPTAGDASSDGTPSSGAAGQEPPAAGVETMAGFPVLPPLAVLLPENPGAVAPVTAPAPGRVGPVPARPDPEPGKPSAGGEPGTKSPARAPVVRAAPVLSGGAWLPPLTPGLPAALPAPASVVRSYDGCPPMYYPPGPGCIEQAPQE